MEHTRRDAAESYALKVVLLSQVKATAIALGQLLLLMFGRPSALDDRSDGVDDVLGGQVIALCDDGIARIQKTPLHDVGTLLAQLDARSGVDAIVDAVVQRRPTAQGLCVGGVHDGIHFQAGDVALPYLQAIAGRSRHAFCNSASCAVRKAVSIGLGIQTFISARIIVFRSSNVWGI